MSDEIVQGTQVVGFDAQQIAPTGPRLVPTASIADHIVVRAGDELVRLAFSTRPVRVDNIGRLPMAWVDPAAADSRTVVAGGPEALAEYQRALDEWRLLTASALVGLVEETMAIAAEFAKTRYTLGVPIGTLQGFRTHWPTSRSPYRAVVAWHAGPLGSSTTSLPNGPNSRRLRSSSWPRKPPRPPRWPCVQGGLGVSAEAAATAYLVRARGWALAGGDPAATAVRIAEIVAARESRV